MAIQELDLKIKHHSGRSNSNADALSRSPLPAEHVSVSEADGVIATMEPGDCSDHPTRQRDDSDLAAIIGDRYPTSRIRTGADSGVVQLTVCSGRRVLYKVEPDSTLRVIPPKDQRERLFSEAHSGVFGAHLSDVKVHSELRRHYWWNGMRRDVTQWTRGCLVCISHSPSRAVHAPLTPVPVNGPFDRIGVHVIQFLPSHLGNQYAVVFMDYLTKWPEVYPTPDQSAATIANLLPW